jgi:hypothetical protein
MVITCDTNNKVYIYGHGILWNNFAKHIDDEHCGL